MLSLKIKITWISQEVIQKQTKRNPCPYGNPPIHTIVFGDDWCKSILNCNGECHPNYGKGSSISQEQKKKPECKVRKMGSMPRLPFCLEDA